MRRPTARSPRARTERRRCACSTPNTCAAAPPCTTLSPGRRCPPTCIGRAHGSQQLGEELGRGSSGKVYRAFNRETGEFRAIKEIAIKDMPESGLRSVQSEIELLNTLQVRPRP